jgi:hypothetical protein
MRTKQQQRLQDLRLGTALERCQDYKRRLQEKVPIFKNSLCIVLTHTAHCFRFYDLLKYV